MWASADVEWRLRESNLPSTLALKANVCLENKGKLGVEYSEIS